MHITRIAQLIDTDGIGGAEVLVLELSRALQEHGLHPVLVHFANDSLEQRAYDLKLECFRLGPIPSYKKTLSLPIFWFQFASILRRQKFDLLHAHLFGPITGATPAARLAGIPVVGTLHDIYTVAEKPNRIHLLRLARYLGAKLYSVSDAMQEFYGTAPMNLPTECIYNGVDTITFSPKSRAEDGTFRIISVGRLVELKRFSVLLQTVALLQPQMSLHLTILGDGPLRETLENEAAMLGIRSHVSFLGEQQAVAQQLQNADVFCLASETEGMSRSILEAMSCGLPIVASAVGGNTQLVTDGQNGFLIADATPESFAKALNILHTDSALRNRCGAVSRSIVEANFSFELMVKRYIDSYNYALNCQ